MTAQIYRQHHEITSPSAWPAVQQICDEWVELNSSPSTCRIASRWRRRNALLSECSSPGDVVDFIDQADSVTTNELFWDLLTWFREGQQLAGRVLLQAMLPALMTDCSALLRRIHSDYRGDLETGTMSVQLSFVAEFWSQLDSIGLHARGDGRLPATLRFNTKRNMTQMYYEHAARVPTTTLDVAEATIAAPEELQPENATEVSLDHIDLLDVLDWCERRNVITAGEAELVRAITIDNADQPGFNLRVLAEHMGITHANLRQRYSRIQRRIISAVQAEIDETNLVPADMTTQHTHCS